MSTRKAKDRKAVWSGRFRGGPSDALRAIGDSLHFDRRLVVQDLTASIAHARMLGRQKIVPARDAARIVRELESMRAEIGRGDLRVEGDDEDVHSWIERTLTERIGEAGARLHTARSRNDQVATAFRMFVRDEAILLAGVEIRALVVALVDQAERELGVIVPAYTHMQRGQPVLLSHQLLAYAEMLARDTRRFFLCAENASECPLGSGAATGVPYPIDRDAVAHELDMEPCENSMDAVSDRDFAVEFLAASALLAVHLSRLAEDVCLWASSEWALLELDDSVSTGSSIMPQKRNPDGAELTRGKTGRVIGHLTALLTTLKGLPMTYDRDLQEDKEAVFDAVDAVRSSLRVMADTLSRSRFRPDAAERLLRRGHLLATELADFLVGKGVPFRHAHEVVGRAGRGGGVKGVARSDLDAAALETIDERFAGCGPALDFRRAVNRRDHVGGTATRQVKRALADWRRTLRG